MESIRVYTIYRTFSDPTNVHQIIINYRAHVLFNQSPKNRKWDHKRKQENTFYGILA